MYCAKRHSFEIKLKLNEIRYRQVSARLHPRRQQAVPGRQGAERRQLPTSPERARVSDCRDEKVVVSSLVQLLHYDLAGTLTPPTKFCRQCQRSRGPELPISWRSRASRSRLLPSAVILSIGELGIKEVLWELTLAHLMKMSFRFDLAIQLGDLDTAYGLAKESGSEQKWKQLAELATSQAKFDLAQQCLHEAQVDACCRLS